jgi:hypothetical protein
MAKHGRGGLGRRVLRIGRHGLGPFRSPERLVAARRRGSGRSANVEAQVRSLIRLHCAEAAVQAAASGLGGILTLPVTLPLSLLAGGVIQARLAYAIALLYGHDPDAAETAAGVADAVTGAERKTAASYAPGKAGAVLRSRVGNQIARRVGTRLLARVGGEGAARVVPFVGAVLAAALDYGFTKQVAGRAVATFRR